MTEKIKLSGAHQKSIWYDEIWLNKQIQPAQIHRDYNQNGLFLVNSSKFPTFMLKVVPIVAFLRLKIEKAQNLPDQSHPWESPKMAGALILERVTDWMD